MPFWKSAPYLIHFMRGYKFNERLDETLDLSPSKLAGYCDRIAGLSCRPRPAPVVRARSRAPQDARNGERSTRPRRLAIAVGAADSALLATRSPFRDTAGVTKTLLFSAWNVVPDVVSAVLSYEAERRMTGGRIRSYMDPARQQVPLLRLTQSAARVRSRHRLLLLLLPCLTLADLTHPLNAPPGHDRSKWVRDAVETMLSVPGLPDPQDGPVDDRWEWAAPLLLDPELRTFLEAWRDGDIPAINGDESLPRPNPEFVRRIRRRPPQSVA